MRNVIRKTAASGVPVYVERSRGSPGIALNILVRSGSVHDARDGKSGARHILEHALERGSKTMPNGPADFDRNLGRHGIKRNGEIEKEFTYVELEAPKAKWKEALRHGLELFARPLLREEDVAAERRIVLQEIHDDRSDPYSRFIDWIEPLAYGAQHPLGWRKVGKISCVREVDAEMVRRIHSREYTWQRAVVLFSGDVAPDAVARVVSDYVTAHPLRADRPRQGRDSFGPVKLSPTATFRRRSGADTTYINRSYQFGAGGRFSLDEIAAWEFVVAAYMYGDYSPLMQLFREDEQMGYEVEATTTFYQDAADFTLVAKTNRADTQRTLAMMDLLPSFGGLRSKERFEWLRDHLHGRLDIEPTDPKFSLEAARNDILRGLPPTPRKKFVKAMTSLSYRQYLAMLDSLAASEHVVTFISYGKE